ncbi:MAG TPA: AMP-binding protein, partial [Kofleriaceae bacterium]|nr:AMP-binding protein [Kofleriaceae bacterium]
MLEALRKQVDRARLVVRALRATQVVQPVRPAALAEFVRDAIKLPRGPHLATVFHAASHPDKEALIEYAAHGVKRMTWGEMDATVNRLGNALVARGAGPGSRVALMLPNGSEYLIAQQALARLGASAVQIGYRLKAGEIEYILGNAEPEATIVHADFLPQVREARDQAHQRGPIIVVGDLATDDGDGAGELTEWTRALAEASPEVQPRRGGGLFAGLAGPSDDGAGVIVYTSGTTGKSKGAHRAWKTTGMESVADMLLQVGVRADDRHLVV